MAEPTPTPSFLAGLLAAVHLDDPASLKRVLAGLFGGIATLLVPVINSRLPTPLDPATVKLGMETLAGLTATYLLQSGANAAVQKLAAAKTAGLEAGKSITTVEQAADELGKAP